MTETPFRRLRRSVITLHRAGLLAPVAGMAVMGASTWAMAATAAAFPDAGLALGDIGTCNPLHGDFGCGHGFGCACHLLPPEAIW